MGQVVNGFWRWYPGILDLGFRKRSTFKRRVRSTVTDRGYESLGLLELDARVRQTAGSDGVAVTAGSGGFFR